MCVCVLSAGGRFVVTLFTPSCTGARGGSRRAAGAVAHRRRDGDDPFRRTPPVFFLEDAVFVGIRSSLSCYHKEYPFLYCLISFLYSRHVRWLPTSGRPSVG